MTYFVAGLALVILMIARCPSATTIRKLREKQEGFLFISLGNYVALLWSHSKVGQEWSGEREDE